MAKKAKKKKAAIAAPTSTGATLATGLQAAKQFFDLAEDETNGEGLRTVIGYNNENIIRLAKSFGYEFDYEEMQEHLIERWGVQKPSKFMYCCT
ncbi:MAG TPA: Nif11-like leader peptide family natural product precursor [Gemmatimonadales bacterium]|nr:Nif11-like leader peptide family natural product precursor [Gemmatimonadales bacterium]